MRRITTPREFQFQEDTTRELQLFNHVTDT